MCGGEGEVVTVTLCGSTAAQLKLELTHVAQPCECHNHNQYNDHTLIYCMLGISGEMLSFVVQLSVLNPPFSRGKHRGATPSFSSSDRHEHGAEHVKRGVGWWWWDSQGRVIHQQSEFSRYAPSPPSSYYIRVNISTEYTMCVCKQG